MARDRDQARQAQRQKDTARVETFIMRARRIEAHSLAHDTDGLRRLSGGSVGLTIAPDRVLMRFDYPPEEVIESAAARVRPLLVADVDVPSVLKSIASLTASTGERDQIRDWTRERTRVWRERTNQSQRTGGMWAMYSSPETGESSRLHHSELAYAWIYGDVVHHDLARLDQTQVWGVGERFRAAVPLVAYVMVEALNVLLNLRYMESHGLISLSPDVWTTPVVAEERYEREVELYAAVPGTDSPTSAGDPLGPEWHPVTWGAITDEGGESRSAQTAPEEARPDSHRWEGFGWRSCR